MYFKLTKQQEELWYAYKLNPYADNYNIAISYQVRGNLDRDKFAAIYQTIGNYFEAFKTRFIEKDGEANQIILDRFDGDVIYQELYHSTQDEILAALEQLRAKPFDLEKDWLFRAILIKTDHDQYYFQFVWHHIISDGLTTTIFSQVFEKLYNEGLDAITQFQTYQLADYLDYEEEIIAKSKKETIDYWQHYLQGCNQNDLVKYNHDDTGQINRKRIDIEPKTFNQFLKKHKTTPFIFFNALISTFVLRCFHLNDLVVSYPKNIRPTEFSKIVGYFVSMFPMRIQLSGEMTFAELLEKIKVQYKKDRECQNIAFEEIGKCLRFDVKPNISVMETLIISPKLMIKDSICSEFRTYYAENQTLFLAYENMSDYFEVKYNQKYIPNYFIEYFENLINEVLTNTDKKLSEYELMSIDQKKKKKKKKLLYDWNKTDKPYQKNKTIHQLFEEQAQKHPDNIAIVFEGKQLTYAQLNAKANQLAKYLRSLAEIKPDTLIALCLDKSLEMIIGILGILKSGAAYVPIDPSYPDERIKYILDDTQATLILSQSRYVSRLQSLSKANIISLDNYCYQGLPIDNLTTVNTSNDLVYVIYTSGTTGQPKGVMIEHKSLINTILFLVRLYKLTDKDHLTEFSSTNFDVSIAEIFTPISKGASLHIFSSEIRKSPSRIIDYINTHKITHTYLPPVVLAQLPHQHVSHLKTISYAGEPCNAKTASHWSHKVQLFNLYGPTEATIYAQCKHIHYDEVEQIGTPIDNTTAYVFDGHFNPVPIEVAGELYIGGAGLARGYLNQPKLTAEKFIVNPFATEEDKQKGYDRLYKTGDLVRWLPDGNLEYIGRKDTQVKIRGFRIELGEIENAVTTIEGIDQAVVINRSVNDEQYLFAYYTAHHPISPELIVEQLANKLPHYMVPSAALQINEIPLTINGKVNIKVLPDIPFQSAQIYIEPRTAQERLVCQAFSTVLLIEKIGIDDDFFRLGGNSIKAIQLSMVLQSNLEIDVAEIFDLRTPRKLAYNKRITHDLLIAKLAQIKQYYTQHHNKPLNSAALLKKEQYLAEVAHMPIIHYTNQSIKTVLLTGATGFLGCNLLHQLLTLTSYQIYLCVRAKDEVHARERMAHKYQFYFDVSLQDHFSDRIIYIACDLEKEQIGLADSEYHKLIKNIDSIIHCAALAKHYGIEQVFYNANVQATIHLLELCQLTNLKDFHYISTYSVMTGISHDNETVLTEDDKLTSDGQWNSPYNKTKYLGEINAIKWREKGINSSIYRVGNLAFMQQNGKVQEDVENNSFANYVKFIRKLGCIADSMNEVEISPADITAQAIIKMFDKNELNNHIHHVFNPNKIQLSQMLKSSDHKIITVNFEAFIDKLINYLHKNEDCDLIGRFLLRMGWQPDGKNSHVIKNDSATILQSKTESMFKMMNFEWPMINNKQLTAYVDRLASTFDGTVETPITAPKYFRLKQWWIRFDKLTNSAKIKMMRLFKAHKKAISIVGVLLFTAPVLYILELLDMIAVLEFLDLSV